MAIKLKSIDTPLNIKVVEFKINPTAAQVKLVDDWLEYSRRLWNMGLGRLNEVSQRYYRAKAEKTCLDDFGDTFDRFVGADFPGGDNELWEWQRFGYSCPIFSNRCQIRQFKSADYDSESKYREYCLETIAKGKEPKPYDKNWIFNQSQKWVKQVAVQKYNKANHWLKLIPSKFSESVPDRLLTAYDRFLKGKGRYPKFKGKNDKVESVETRSAVNELSLQIVTERNWSVKLCTQVWKIKGSCDRLPAEYSVAKICKRASGLYLQITGKYPTPDKEPKFNDRPVGIDVGLKFLISTDQGKTVAPHKEYRQKEARLRRLQRRVSRCEQAMKEGKGTGSNLAKARKAVALTHEKIKYRRKNFNHKLSTKLVREYGAIAVEAIEIKNLVRRVKPKLKADGTGYERTGAKAKSGLSKSFADAGLGQLLGFIKQKAESAGVIYTAVNPAYTSQECSNCGTIVKKALSARTHACTHCGFELDRDHNAAINILEKAEFPETFRKWKRSGMVYNEKSGVWEPCLSSQVVSNGSQNPTQNPLRDGYLEESSKVDLSIERMPGIEYVPATTLHSNLQHEPIVADSSKPSKPVGKTRVKKSFAESKNKPFTQLTLW